MRNVTPILFTLTTLYGVWLFKKLFTPDKKIWIILFIWLFSQALLAINGFYLDEMSTPPKFILLVGPPILLIIYFIFIRKKDISLELEESKLLEIHFIRIPVEVSLLLLYKIQEIPQIMTFEGRNYDILAGITAILLHYFTFKKSILDQGRRLLWNFIGLGLLTNIVFLAIFSVQTPFQKFGFDMPNVAVLNFPYIWLPGFIVPLVLFAHLASIKKLLKSSKLN